MMLLYGIKEIYSIIEQDWNEDWPLVILSHIK